MITLHNVTLDDCIVTVQLNCASDDMQSDQPVICTVCSFRHVHKILWGYTHKERQQFINQSEQGECLVMIWSHISWALLSIPCELFHAWDCLSSDQKYVQRGHVKKINSSTEDLTWSLFDDQETVSFFSLLF